MSNDLRSYFILSLAVLFWGLSFIGAKIALVSFTPYSYVFVRFCLASIIFLLFFFVRGFPKLNRNQHLKLLGLALFQPTLYFIFETIGINNSSATTASLIIATIPIFVMILAYYLLKEKISLIKFIGITLSFLGIYLVVKGDPNIGLTASTSYTGVIFLFLAVLCAALYNVITRNISKGLTTFTISAFQAFYGALFMLPLFIYDMPNFHTNTITIQAMAAIIWLAITSNVIAFLAYNYSLSKLSASQTAVFLNGVPLVTVLGAWLLLGEKLSLLQLLGGAIVILALLMTSNSVIITAWLKQHKKKISPAS